MRRDVYETYLLANDHLSSVICHMMTVKLLTASVRMLLFSFLKWKCRLHGLVIFIQTVTKLMVNSARSSYYGISQNLFTLMEQFNFRQSECSWMEHPRLGKGDGASSEWLPMYFPKLWSNCWAFTAELLPFFCWTVLVKWSFSSETPSIFHRKWNFQFDWSRLKPDPKLFPLVERSYITI